MKLSHFAQMRALQRASTDSNESFLDNILTTEQGEQVRKQILSKRIQFDTTPDFYAEFESICDFLECSKREYLQMAIADSIAATKRIYDLTYQRVTDGQMEFVLEAVESDKD